MDDDVSLIYKIQREKKQNLPPTPQVDLPKLLADGVVKSMIGFDKLKNYITADDIYRQQLADNQVIRSTQPTAPRSGPVRATSQRTDSRESVF